MRPVRRSAIHPIHAAALNVDVAARLRTVGIMSTAGRPRPAGTSFGLVVITPPPHGPNVPRHDLDDEAGMRHLDIEYWPTTTAAH